MQYLRTITGALAVAIASFALPVRANVIRPASAEFANLPNANGLPFSSGTHFYQEVFDSSLFSGPIDLNEVSFRAKDGSTFGLPITLNLEVSLSTTAASSDGLSGTLPSNVGPDSTVVFSAPFTLQDPTGAGSDLAFDVSFPFTTGFTYIPGAGNLLLQLAFPGGIPSGLQYITEDTSGTTTPNGDGISRAIAFSATGSGSADTGGAVVAFGEGPVIVPEPGRIGLILSGLAGLLVIRRNRSG